MFDLVFADHILCKYILLKFFSFYCFIDQFKAINDEGMPMYQRPFMRGKLYIHFTVEFPKSFPCKAQEGVLPPRPSMQMTDMKLDECEEINLHDVNIEKKIRKQQEAYD